MRRRLFTIFSCMSLLLFVVVCVLWVRSYARWDELSVGVRDVALLHLGSGNGSLHVQMASRWRGRTGIQWVSQQRSPTTIRRRILGEDVEHGADPLNWNPPVGAMGRNVGSMIVSRADGTFTWLNAHYRRIPYALIVLFLGVAGSIAPVIRNVLRLRGRRRVQRWLCPSCGYDLRATLEQCPECGAVPAKARA